MPGEAAAARQLTKRTLARGIYEDAYGREVRWRSDGRWRQKRFPLDAPLDQLIAFRQRMRRQAGDRKRVTTGSFVRDVARFLRTRRGRPSYKSDRSHLKPWVTLFRRRSRYDVTKADIDAAIVTWRFTYSPREVRHRVKLLKQLFHHFDPGAPTPCDGVVLPRPKTRKRPPVAVTILAAVATNLLAHEKKEGGTRLRTAQTRARFLILALSGQRPVQLMRTKVTRDVNLEAGWWSVPPAKGDRGTVIALNAQLVAAFRLFIASGAEGPYSTSSFAKTLQRNGWPKDLPVYQLRRRVGQQLRDNDVDLQDVQDHLGHSSAALTREFYVSPSLDRLRKIGEKLDGLFPEDVLGLPPSSTTIEDGQTAKDGHNRPQIARARGDEKSRSR